MVIWSRWSLLDWPRWTDWSNWSCWPARFAQDKKPEPTVFNPEGTITLVDVEDLRPVANVSFHERSKCTLKLLATIGGGLKIRDGDDALVAEIMPDGRITGDPVRALRMLATSMKNAGKPAEKPSPEK